MNIQNATVLVTGANRGLGAEFARQALARGAKKVYAAARDPGSVTLAGVVPAKLDVTDAAAVAALAAALGDVDLVINNAGVANTGSIMDADSAESLRWMLETNVFGILNMLVSVSSFLPIIIAGTISDLIGTTSVILIVAIATFVTGVASFTMRGPLLETDAQADPHAVDPIAAALGADRPTWHEAPTDRWTPPATAAAPPLTEPPAVAEASPLEHAGPSDPTDRD